MVAELKPRAATAGWRNAAKVNISMTLSRSKGLAILTDKGWELTEPGKQHIATLVAAVPGNKVILHTSNSLRTHLAKITDPLSHGFVEEAVKCFEAKQFRAAVVFSWAGAIGVLHKHVFDKYLAVFNAEALRRNSKWQQAKQQDDLGAMKESVFLDVCESLAVMGNNVKQTLQNQCLRLRNSCGHPNSVVIAEHAAASHIEILILNVFSKF